jgi:hypothetical protein
MKKIEQGTSPNAPGSPEAACDSRLPTEKEGITATGVATIPGAGKEAAILDGVKQPVKQKPVKPRAVKPAVKQDRETAVSRGSGLPATMPRILTPRILAEHIEASKLKIAGELAVKGWLLRRGREGRKGTKNVIRTGELDYLIEIYRQLKSEGIE